MKVDITVISQLLLHFKSRSHEASIHLCDISAEMKKKNVYNIKLENIFL